MAQDGAGVSTITSVVTVKDEKNGRHGMAIQHSSEEKPESEHIHKDHEISNVLEPLHYQHSKSRTSLEQEKGERTPQEGMQSTRSIASYVIDHISKDSGYNMPQIPQVLRNDDDYTRKYPPDECGMEMGPDARVWKTYLDETDVADKDYISDNNGTLDGILVFVRGPASFVCTKR